MFSTETKGNQSQLKVRPGLLLFFIAVLALAVVDRTGLAASLAGSALAVKRVILFIATIVTACGWFSFFRDYESWRLRRAWIPLAAALILTISIPFYVLFALVPVKFFTQFMPLSTAIIMTARWIEVVAELAWIGPFFGRGRSRVAFVLAGTLMLLLWSATYLRTS